jgi:uncharacterized protein with HEPN domain
MPRTASLALADIVEAIDGIAIALQGRSFEEFQADWLLRHGVQRGIEIISEASRHIPEDLKARRPEIPWTEVAGIGSILRHAYHRVSDQVIWNTATHALAPLRVAVIALLADLQA